MDNESHPPNYDRFPSVPVPAPHSFQCWSGWEKICERLRAIAPKEGVIAVECYPGVLQAEISQTLAAALNPACTLDSRAVFLPPYDVDCLVEGDLGGDDPVFGRMTELTLSQFLDDKRLRRARQEITKAQGLVLIVGPAATLVAPNAKVLIYADMPRWEGQLRQRRGEVPNLGAANRGEKASLQYKRSFFVDWRVADRHKLEVITRADFLLDTTAPAAPKLITGAAHLAGLEECVKRPLRLVPFFDPGPWGGQWMRRVCGLPEGPPNYAWCFDCVPEENSLMLEFAEGARVEIPALNLVLLQSATLLGLPVFQRFGREFPIRFDLLDTMGGGNLSFQVHPPTDYARKHFGLNYTQDESYYMLDAEPGAAVYLGYRDGTDPPELMRALETARDTGGEFDDARFLSRFPARAHDHFLIPAGTLHCSGAGSMVLEISATPYIFTFKLWDWNRLGLDGKPRPLNIARGRDTIDWSRDESFARRELVNHVTEVANGKGWREERTGLHPAEFIETRRHWFSGPVEHDTGGVRKGGVNVLNLVAGRAAWVESPNDAFPPFKVHYAESFIIPAAVGPYTIRPAEECAGQECASVKAFVRPARP